MAKPQHRLPVFLGVAIILSLAVNGCNLAGRGRPTDNGAGYIYTAAALTVAAQVTPGTPEPSTQPVDLSTATAAAETPTSQPVATEASPTSPPAATTAASSGDGGSTASGCDKIKFVQDVTIPDNTRIPPGATFVKTWRLQNAGTCTWSSAYTAVFVDGFPLGAPASVQVTSGSVAPGQTIDVSVTFVAPQNPGTYRSDWKLRNASNQLFGLGDGTKSFFVQVKVGITRGLVFDFLATAKDASWLSGVGESPNTNLTFGGDDEDPSGVARIVDKVKLETGAKSGKVLLTVPKHEDNGMVMGIFPAYVVQPGDHILGRLGFIVDGACDAGKAEFRIYAKIGDDMNQLGKWNKACTGSFTPVDVDLSNLKGQTVQFVLQVLADGSYEQDLAIWNSLRIEN